MSRSKYVVFAALTIVGLVLAACAPAVAPTATQAPAAQAPTQAAAPARPTDAPVVKPTEPPAPPTAEPVMAEAKSKDPATFVYMTFGEPQSFDPHIDYESAGSNVLQNVYEGLVFFSSKDPIEFEPQLAESIPEPVTTDDGGVSYTWQIIDGVKFHNGDPMTTEDVAYSFWRTLLLGDPNAPTILMTQPFFNTNDPTELVDPSGALTGDAEALKQVDAAKLEAACQRVKDAVTFDEASRTLTMKLVHPWGPFIATLGGGGWGYVVDKKWVAEQVDWEGDCNTCQTFYGIPIESG
ncbi:MAG: hypothetical protein HY870_06065, partial [Chloroflexi bacterium]|nr:hypothetical protein [Chloroflexota bacterium]